MSTNRRPRWHPPPPPTPKILHFPRRTRRKPTGKPDTRKNHKGKLESLFDEERVFARTSPIVLVNSGDCERRVRVEDFDFETNDRFRDNHQEDKWRFQAEMLRAECNILRMERDIALKKLELYRVQTNRTLRSAVETLISGKKKIYEGKSVGIVLEEEIEDLEEKLKDLQRSSSCRDRHFEIRKCSNNLDKQASVLKMKLEKLGAGLVQEKCVKEIRQMAEASLSIKTSCRFDQDTTVSGCEHRFKEVEMLRRKMQMVSKGMLERMEDEYGSMLSSSSSAASSTSTSTRIEIEPPHSSTSAPQMLPNYQGKSHEDRMCSGQCKTIVGKIVEQVRSEMEQWSRMQEMLGRVKEEMEELQASRDFWQSRAFDSADRIQSLESNEWKQKARLSETKVSQLEKQVSELHLEVGALKSGQRKTSSSRTISLLPLQQESQKEKEKKVLICSLKENSNNNKSGNANRLIKDLDDEWRNEHPYGGRSVLGPKRSPLREIGNSSTMLKQKSRAVFPVYSPEVSH